MGGKKYHASPGLFDFLAKYFPGKNSYDVHSNMPSKKPQQPTPPKKYIHEYTVAKLILAIREHKIVEGQEIGLKVKKETDLYLGLPEVARENIKGTEFKIPKTIDELVHSESFEKDYGEVSPPEILGPDIRYGELYMRGKDWYFFEPSKTQSKSRPFVSLAEKLKIKIKKEKGKK